MDRPIAFHADVHGRFRDRRSISICSIYVCASCCACAGFSLAMLKIALERGKSVHLAATLAGGLGLPHLRSIATSYSTDACSDAPPSNKQSELLLDDKTSVD
jgi:hypothetical protein